MFTRGLFSHSDGHHPTNRIQQPKGDHHWRRQLQIPWKSPFWLVKFSIFATEITIHFCYLNHHSNLFWYIMLVKYTIYTDIFCWWNSNLGEIPNVLMNKLPGVSGLWDFGPGILRHRAPGETPTWRPYLCDEGCVLFMCIIFHYDILFYVLWNIICFVNCIINHDAILHILYCVKLYYIILYDIISLLLWHIILYYFISYITLYYITLWHNILSYILFYCGRFFFVFQPGFVAFVGVWLLWLYQYLSIYLSNLT
jgi:hypothetical protein